MIRVEKADFDLSLPAGYSGFQISGRLVPMWFTAPAAPDASLTWVLLGRFAFSQDWHDWYQLKDGRYNISWLEAGTPNEHLEMHVCSFFEVMYWVDAWGIELRRRGWVTAPPLDEAKMDLDHPGFNLNGCPTRMHIPDLADADQCYRWYIYGGVHFKINNADTPREHLSIQVDSFPQMEEWVRSCGRKLNIQRWWRDQISL